MTLDFHVKIIMAIIGIVAIARNYAIGKGGKLPWHYPADLKFFKQTTLDQAVVMGWNTWESIGKPLPKRLNIVLSRSKDLASQPNLLLLRSKQEVLALAAYLKCDVFLIGGAQTYEEFSDSIDEWTVTEIPEKIENADVFMPEDFLKDFQLKAQVTLETDLPVKIYARSGINLLHDGNALL